jgi:outer membrane receptor for ferrienterochelin and colicin
LPNRRRLRRHLCRRRPAQIEPVNEEVVVSATKMAQDPLDIPADITVVSGEELRRMGTTTLAEA